MPALLPDLETSVTVPDLSVVIASVNGWSVLSSTLDSLESLPERDQIEIIVVETLGAETRERLRDEYPSVVIVEASRQAIPKLRYQGVMRSKGRLIAILEDHAEVESDWAASIFRAHEGPWAAVGGAVENGLDGLTNWAVFFCEYTAYMPPVPEGVYGDIPGNNIAYKRPYLHKHARELEQGKWESWINDRIRVDGASIASTNAMVVRHIKPFRFGYFLNQRFHFARSYAGMRRVDQSWPKRLAYGAGSTILPVLLTARLTRAVISKRRDLGRFLLVFPLVVLFLTVGAVGEMVGYLLGAGDSLEKVE
jgi:hypothetical protein